MTINYDIGIIGAGISGTFAALRAAEIHKDSKVILFELGRPPSKRRRQIEGFLGCFPTGDGKIYTGDIDKVLDIVDGRKANPANKWVTKWFEEVNPMKIIKDKLPSAAIQKKLSSLNYEIELNNYVQWKPDSVHQLSRLITEVIDTAGNITFSFDNEVFKIFKQKDTFLVTTADGNYTCKKLILCAGRSGWRWTNKLYKELGILANDDFAIYGIRVELSAQQMKDFNKTHCKLKKDNLEIGPFNWNGTVIPEDHADLVISSFRSNEDRWKTDKVSFSILSKQYFQNDGCRQTDRLGKLAFLLFNDRIGREKVRSILKNVGQLSVLPEYNWLIPVLTELTEIIPSMPTKAYYHSPDILPMASQVRLGSNLESEIENLFIAGESAGIQGIAAAAITGAIAMDSDCK